MNWLTQFTELLFLLARLGPVGERGWFAGRRWERLVASAFEGAGAWTWQGAGSLSLFGFQSASGLRHELDAAGRRGDTTIIVEAKCRSTSPPKGDILCFDRKSFDIYVSRVRSKILGAHYRLLASTAPFTDEALKYCYLYAVLTVDPALVPLPLLVHVAGKPAADLFFERALLEDLVRLGESASAPLEQRFVPDGEHLRFRLNSLTPAELDDLVWLHRELSGQLLDVIDREAAGWLEARAADLGLPAQVKRSMATRTR